MGKLHHMVISKQVSYCCLGDAIGSMIDDGNASGIANINSNRELSQEARKIF